MNSKPTKAASGSFRGVFSALVTPMKANGDIDHARLDAFAAHQIRQGIHGLIPLGSTGEFYALTAHEREQVIKTTLAAAGRVPVVAGANAGSTRDVIGFAQWVKTACGLMGHDCGVPRPPLAAATKAECVQLRQALWQCAEGRKNS